MAGDDLYQTMYLSPAFNNLPSEALYNQVWNTLRPKLEAEFGVGVCLYEGEDDCTFQINVDRVKG